MRIIVNVDEQLGAEIEAAAQKLEIKKAEWVRTVCKDYFSPPESSDNEKDGIIEDLNKEILSLIENSEIQKEIQETYSKLISEKDQRIEDLKESISRIEAMSITITDQISSSKDERIKDLTQMIEHLQAQAAAHSAALHSALKPALESENGKKEPKSDDYYLISKPKWMFWK